jgi:predicted PurR-regulated permease PerM
MGARGMERNQIKWVALARLVLVLALVVVFATVGFSSTQSFLADVLLALAFTTIFFAVAIAVLRYRLYEIDRIISRTVSYGLVSAVLIGVYLGAVFVLGNLLRLQGELAVAGSTLLAAALFNPLRRRVQHLVDRRFNRSRFDTERTMEGLSRRLSSQVDLLELGRELQVVAHQTMQPTTVAVWLR